MAAALLDGPLEIEDLREHYRTMARRAGIFADPFAVVSEEGYGPEAHLRDTLDDLINQGWVIREGSRYRLTETGGEKARLMLGELEKGRRFFDAVTDPRRVSVVTLICHFVLAALKIPAAVVSGSVGLLNDALDTLMDGVSSVIVYLGFRFNRARAATIALVSFMLITGGYTFYEAVSSIIRPEPTSPDVLAFVAAAVSAVVCFLLWLYQKFAGLRNESMTLIAQSVDSRNHVLVAVGVTAALISAALEFPFLDRVVGLVIAVLILRSAVELLRDLRTEGAEGSGESLSKYGFPGLQRLRRRQFVRWLLYLVSENRIAGRDELMNRAEQAMDFRKIPSITSVGFHEPRWAERLRRDGIDAVYSSGYVEGSPLRLTDSGRDVLNKSGPLESALTRRTPAGRVLSAALRIPRLVFSAAVFIALYLGSRWVLRHLPNADLWQGGEVLFAVAGVEATVPDLVHFGLGLVISLIGSMSMPRVSHLLRHSRSRKTREPRRLITAGPFKNVRHPLYRGMILGKIGWGIATHSLWGVGVGLLLTGVHAANAVREERELRERFGTEHKDYVRTTKALLFRPGEWVGLGLVLCASVAGLFIGL